MIGRHSARELPPLEEDTPVFIASGRDSNVVPGRVTGCASARLYLVETPPDCQGGTEVI